MNACLKQNKKQGHSARFVPSIFTESNQKLQSKSPSWFGNLFPSFSSSGGSDSNFSPTFNSPARPSAKKCIYYPMSNGCYTQNSLLGFNNFSPLYGQQRPPMPFPSSQFSSFSDFSSPPVYYVLFLVKDVSFAKTFLYAANFYGNMF